jgi:hypothetical protein
MNQAVGDHSVEGRSDLQVVLHQLQRAHGGFGGADRLPPGTHQGAGGIHLFLRHGKFVAGDDSGGFRRLLELVRGALGRQLGFGLDPIALGAVHAGLGFGNPRGHFGRTQFDEKLPLLDGASTVHQPCEIAVGRQAMGIGFRFRHTTM